MNIVLKHQMTKIKCRTTYIDWATSESDVSRRLFVFNTNKHKSWGVKPRIDIIYIISHHLLA